MPKIFSFMTPYGPRSQVILGNAIFPLKLCLGTACMQPDLSAKILAPLSLPGFFPAKRLGTLRYNRGTRALSKVYRRIRCGTISETKRYNGDIMRKAKGIKRNIIDMLWISTETLTANFSLTGTKRRFTRVLFAEKYLQIS
jgi:hypothetical protein